MTREEFKRKMQQTLWKKEVEKILKMLRRKENAITKNQRIINSN